MHESLVIKESLMLRYVIVFNTTNVIIKMNKKIYTEDVLEKVGIQVYFSFL